MQALHRQGLLRRPGTVVAWRAFAACCPDAEAFSRPRPGTVRPYDHHVLVELPPSGSAASSLGGSWPKLVERHPAILSVFAAVAKHRELIDGTVKVTAMEGLPGMHSPGAGACHMLVFPAGIEYVNLPIASAGHCAVHGVADSRPDLRPLEAPALAAKMHRLQHKLYIFVCCHSARDARCGQRGPDLVTSLRQSIDLHGASHHVAVAATSHIGGHEFAGNVVLYGPEHPCDGDWFGGLRDVDADTFVESLLSTEIGCDGGAEHPVLRRWWRGRMGLGVMEQEALFESSGWIQASDAPGLSDDEKW